MLKGPSWLTTEFKDWPKYPLMNISPNHKSKVNVNLNQIVKVNTGILDINKYSNYDKLLKVTSMLFKPFYEKIKYKSLQKAKMYRIRITQTENFSKEISFLKLQDKSNTNISTLVSILNFFLVSNGILRSKGRMSKCLYFNYDVYNPVLLRKGNKFTSLFIKHSHGQVQHIGTGTTLNYLREQGMWIARGLTAVKTEINNCTICKKYNALVYKYPKVVDMSKHQMN